MRWNLVWNAQNGVTLKRAHPFFTHFYGLLLLWYILGHECAKRKWSFRSNDVTWIWQSMPFKLNAHKYIGRK